MTAEEKPKHFQDICMGSAREHSTEMLDDCMNALEKAHEERTADARRRANMQVEAEAEKLEREINGRPSIGQLDLKRELSHRQGELKDKLFVELKDKLVNFIETQEYQQLLDRQVKEAKTFAEDEELTIYMDPSGGDKLQRIAMYHNASIKLSEYSFTGGVRVVIPGKRILIDSLFETRLSEARHESKPDLGSK